MAQTLNERHRTPMAIEVGVDAVIVPSSWFWEGTPKVPRPHMPPPLTRKHTGRYMRLTCSIT